MHQRPHDGDPHTADVGAARVEVVRPYEELRLWADPDRCELGMDLTFRARTRPYGLRRGTMRAGSEMVWDQSHMFQSGTYEGTYTVDGTTYEVDRWWGQRDHSWGIRDHGRCPLWLWFQVQLPDGFLGVWHWELANGARVYTDGCWAPTDGSDPVPARRLPARGRVGRRRRHAGPLRPARRRRRRAAGHRDVHPRGRASASCVEADGTFDRPYEPFHRGGLNQMRVRTDDGREGTAIFEVTGARHHRMFPDTEVEGVLPT